MHSIKMIPGATKIKQIQNSNHKKIYIIFDLLNYRKKIRSKYVFTFKMVDHAVDKKGRRLRNEACRSRADEDDIETEMSKPYG